MELLELITDKKLSFEKHTAKLCHHTNSMN